MAVVFANITAMPGLSATVEADFDFWLDMSAQFVGTNTFGSGATHDRAVKLWIAHALALQTESGMGSSGAVTSKKVGDVSVGYGSSSVGGAIGSANWLGQTQWGKLYKGLAHVYGGAKYPVV